MPRDGVVAVVHDPVDDVERLRFVQRLHDPADGRLVISLVKSRSSIAVSRMVLAALGKTLGATGAYKGAGPARAEACVWMAAEPISDLFVLRAHFAPQQTTSLIHLALQAGCRVWLIDQQPTLPDRHLEALEDYGGAIVSFEAFQEQWRHSSASAAAPAAASGPYPPVPRAPFLVFERACRLLLRDADLDRVLADYARMRARVRDALTEGADAAAERLRHVSYDRQPLELYFAAERLLSEIAQCLDRDEIAVRARALQHAAYDLNLYLDLDPDAVAPIQRRAARLDDPSAADGLRIYRSTRYPATVIALTATGSSHINVGALLLADVASDGAAIAGTPVPAHLQRFIRAHLFFRRLQGGRDDDAFLNVGRPRHQARTFGTLLKRVALDTGLPVADYWTDRTASYEHRSDIAWAITTL